VVLLDNEIKWAWSLKRDGVVIAIEGSSSLSLALELLELALDKDNVFNNVTKGVTLSSGLTLREIVDSSVNDLTILNSLNEVVVLNLNDNTILKNGVSVLVVDFDDFTFFEGLLSGVGGDFGDLTLLNIFRNEVLGDLLDNIFAVVLNLDEVNSDFGDLAIFNGLSDGLTDDLGRILVAGDFNNSVENFADLTLIIVALSNSGVLFSNNLIILISNGEA